MSKRHYFKPTGNIEQTADAIVDEIEKMRQEADRDITPYVCLGKVPTGMTHDEFHEWFNQRLAEQGIDDLTEYLERQIADLEQDTPAMTNKHIPEDAQEQIEKAVEEYVKALAEND